jgi:hypothetical protein
LIPLLLHSFCILDTLFLTWRCMVPWNHWFILACFCLCEPFKLVNGFSPFSLGNQILSMFLKWQHKAIYCFHEPIILSPSFPMITLFGYQVIGCYKKQNQLQRTQVL